MIKSNASVFDFDGTISVEGKISDENKLFLKNIQLKAINTSRSLDELPVYIRKNFNYIMTLNGSVFYKNQKVVKTYKVIDGKKVQELINFALKHDYNIAFNNTKTAFCNVKNDSSKGFMKKNGIIFTEKIIVPSKVFQIAISSSTKVIDFKGCKRQSEKFIEYSSNDKSNIADFFEIYTAYGDSENDMPMFKKAFKYHLVKNADLKATID